MREASDELPWSKATLGVGVEVEVEVEVVVVVGIGVVLEVGVEVVVGIGIGVVVEVVVGIGVEVVVGVVVEVVVIVVGVAMKLNLCCGANIFPGWVNIDSTDVERDYVRHLREAPPGFVWPPAQQPLAEWVKAGKPLDVRRHDVRKGLPFETGSVDAIYVGQAIEHFNRRTEAPAFLRECCRVLRQYGVIKLTTPAMGKLLDAIDANELDDFSSEQPAFYADALPEDQLAYLLFGASGPDSTNEHYEGHHHCYTPRSLAALLGECGFDVRSKDSSEFADTVDMGMSHSFAIEGVKP